MTLNAAQGDAIWVDQSIATNDRLAYVDNNGKAILRVDNFTNVPWNEKRNTVGSTSIPNEEIMFTVPPRSGSRPRIPSQLGACSCLMPRMCLMDAASGQVKITSLA